MITAQADLSATLKASLFYDETQRKLREATTERDLEDCAKALDGADYDALPPGAREDLAVLYARQLFLITGAFVG